LTSRVEFEKRQQLGERSRRQLSERKACLICPSSLWKIIDQGVYRSIIADFEQRPGEPTSMLTPKRGREGWHIPG
jgi:hypothetical protein